jgi:hypothetical protein
MENEHIDWFMVSVKQDNLAEAMGFANTGLGDDAISFFDKFRRSGWMSRFEKSEGRATLGCSGSELVLMSYDRLGQTHQPSEFNDECNFNSITTSVEYWIGYALGYLQGRSGLTFKSIFDHFPLESWYNMYILHEVSDETLWDKTLGRYHDEKCQ